MQLAALDLFQGRLAEGAARYVSLAIPRWEAVTFDTAAMCAAYAGDLDDARRFNERARATASSPSIRAYNHYVTAEIDNLAGDWPSALAHYRESIAVSGTVGTAHTHGIASVGLVAVQAASGQVREALAGYRRLIDHWQRIGAWTQQWTTLRNAADLFDQLGDHDLALFLRDAADRAPEASFAGATTGRPQADDADSRPPTARGGAHTRDEVLDIAREAIAQWLAAIPSG
jgi:tetratricopeptide (TPR) repeat protein